MKSQRILPTHRASFRRGWLALAGLIGASLGSLQAGTITDKFTAPGATTWVAPAGVTQVVVEAWGGGGRGGSRTSGSNAYGGGGGGGYSRSVLTVTPGQSYNIMVGAGATTNSADGGNTYFIDDTTLLARGGATVPNNTATGGAGASVGIGDVTFAGGSGRNGNTSGTDYGGGGGSSAGYAASGTDATNQNGATAPLGGGNGGNGRFSSDGNGLTGDSPGGGGGGALRADSGSPTGGNGGNGQLFITYYSETETVTLTSAGTTTWTAPQGVTQVTVEAWGGGGRGGSRNSSDGRGMGGGGGGAYSRSVLTVVPGQDYTVVVGAGSTSNLSAGGDSYFNTVGTLLAKGGGTVATDSATGAAGGSAAAGVGDVKFSGGAGSNGYYGTGTDYGGGGGSSAGPAADGTTATGTATGATAPTGGGDGGNGFSSTSSSGAGSPGSSPGGGGGGALRYSSGTFAGGNGANGQVRITYDAPFNEFTANDVWIAPPGVTEVIVEAWGGGGKGGARSSSSNGAGGGGGGAYSRSTLTVVPGQAYTIQVGQGATTTTAGGDSFFGSDTTLLAKGGGSVSNNSTSGAAGGSAAAGVGDFKWSGGNGANASGTSYGGGGGSSAGTDADGATATNATGATAPAGGGDGGNGRSSSNGNGVAGSTPGGGGGGALRTSSGSASGGNGANGKVLISVILPSTAEIAVYDGIGIIGSQRTDDVGTAAFGSVVVGSSSTAQSYTIRNTGVDDLEISGITVGGTDDDQFTVDLTGLDTTLATNETTTFTVTFSPTSTGAKSAVVNIASNDADENPFRINVSGTGTAPEIAVYDGIGTGGAERTDNVGTASFGSVNTGSSSTAQSFTIENKGTGTLTISDITLGGTDDDQFSLDLTGVDYTLAASETTTFTVTFSPTSAGAKAAVVNIASDDADEDPFRINVGGTGVAAPEIAVFNGVGTGGTQRADNVGTVGFGSVVVTSSSAAQSFTVENKGTALLNISSITLSGANDDQFSLDLTGVDYTLAASETTTFTVTFSPTTPGSKSAVVNIASDDTDENPFRINVGGSGLAGSDIIVTDQTLTPADGLTDGGSIYRPMPGVINQSDQVSFKAFGKVGTGGILAGNDGLLITDVSGDLHVIGREGAIVEGSTTLTGLFTDILLNDGGHTVAFDRIKGSVATRDQAYFLSENGIDLEILSRTGDNAPGGGKFKPANRSIVTDSDDRFYFSSGLTGTGVNTKTDTGIWQEDAGTLSLLIREGEDLTDLTTDPAWLGAITAKLSAAGDGVAFIANLQNNPANAKEKTSTALNTVVLSGNETGFDLVARKGDTVPDTADNTLLTLVGVSRSATGTHAVLGLMKTATGVTKANDQVLISVSGGTTRLVAREGTTLIGGTAMKAVREFYAIGDEEVIFLTDRALCRWTVSGGITVLARIGSAAPGLGTNFKLMNQLSVSTGGAIALVTSLVDGRVSLWRGLPGGALTLVHTTGDAITLNALPETILGLAIHTATTSAGGGGGGSGSAINDAGTIFATISVGGGKHVARKLTP
jgi:hypothetical protein